MSDFLWLVKLTIKWSQLDFEIYVAVKWMERNWILTTNVLDFIYLFIYLFYLFILVGSNFRCGIFPATRENRPGLQLVPIYLFLPSWVGLVWFETAR